MKKHLVYCLNNLDMNFADSHLRKYPHWMIVLI